MPYLDLHNKNDYQKFLPISQNRILRKLIQAVIREKAVEYEWLPGEFPGGTYILQASLNRKILITVKNTSLLGHIEIDGPVLLVENQERIELTHPVPFLQAVFDVHSSDSSMALINELENSVTNDCIALAAENYRRESEIHSYGTRAFDTLISMQNSNPLFSPLTYLEQWATEGHTLHPCSKTRIGLSREENEKYSPEWAAEVELVLLAVHKSHCSSSRMGEHSMTELLVSDYPFISKELEGLESYALIPVHPWQYEHTIKKYYQDYLEKRLIIPLQSVIPAKPLISFRSMAPSHGSKLHHIKTAVNIQMTSARRLVSPASVQNGPIISQLLKDIEKHDSFLKGRIVFLSEVAGSHFTSSRKYSDIDLEKNLSCLIRENPEACLAQDELAVPAASLIHRLPFTSGSLLKDLVTGYSEENKISTEEGAEKYLELYAKTLIPSLVHLVVRYGISLEAHLQNAIIIFKEGKPAELMIRDSGGIRIHESLISQWLKTARIDNSTNLLTDRQEDLYQMFSHAVLHNHLGEIIVKLARELNINETTLWAKIKDVLLQAVSDAGKQQGCSQHASQFERWVFGPDTYLKALLKMRLYDSVTDNMYVKAPNPLISGMKGERS